MPVPSSWSAPQQEKKEFNPIPKGIYQALIGDVKMIKAPKYNNPNETEDKLEFTFIILDEGEYKGRKLWKSARPIMSAGDSQFSPSTFNVIYEAVMKHSPFDDQLTAITGKVVNSFIGKQLQLVVKIGKRKKDGAPVNKIDTFLEAKSALPLPVGWYQVIDPEVPGEEYPEPEDDIDVKDIPF